MKKNNLDNLQIILQGAQKILSLTKDINSAEELKQHAIAGDAVIINFVSIIDSVKQIDNELRKELPFISWNEFEYFEKELADIRFTFNMDLAWKLITTKLPELENLLKNYIEKQ